MDRHLSEDVFILLVVGIALSYGGLALVLNLSEVLGAFLAGIILAEVQRTQVLEHLVLQVRDLFLPLFFFLFWDHHNFRRRYSYDTFTHYSANLVHRR